MVVATSQSPRFSGRIERGRGGCHSLMAEGASPLRSVSHQERISKMEDTLQIVLQPFVQGGKIMKEDDYGEHTEVQLPFAAWFEAVDHLNGRGCGLNKFEENGRVIQSTLISDNYDEKVYAILAEFSTVEGFQAVSKKFEACLELPG